MRIHSFGVTVTLALILLISPGASGQDSSRNASAPAPRRDLSGVWGMPPTRELSEDDKQSPGGRGVTGIVFVAFLAYLADEVRSGKPWRFGSRGEETPLDALLGLIIIGLPCLRYTLVGRFGSDDEVD
jgi:hypothetical protein